MPRPVHIIAEMACSHDGSPELARRIIDGAGAACADSLQFQIWRLEDMMVRTHPAFDQVKNLELTPEDWRGLAAHVRNRWPGLAIIACVYDLASVDFAESLEVDAYKLHSADLSNPYLVRHMATTGRRIDLSVGGSTIGEIQNALRWIDEVAGNDVWLMYGYQNFPTRVEDVHLAYMMKLARLFELPVGYQDHTDADAPGAFSLPAAAQGMGVQILEKHVTHDRAAKCADHEAALNTDEFARFTAMVREIEAATGSALPRPFSRDEERYRAYCKKSVVAASALAAGHRIAEADLTFLRADALGLPPDRAPDIVGRRLRRDVACQELVRLEDVA